MKRHWRDGMQLVGTARGQEWAKAINDLIQVLNNQPTLSKNRGVTTWVKKWNKFTVWQPCEDTSNWKWWLQVGGQAHRIISRASILSSHLTQMKLLRWVHRLLWIRIILLWTRWPCSRRMRGMAECKVKSTRESAGPMIEARRHYTVASIARGFHLQGHRDVTKWEKSFYHKRLLRTHSISMMVVLGANTVF
jgi:hypothetical protein